MKIRRTTLWIAVALLLPLFVAPARPQTQDNFFDASVLHRVDIEIRPSDWRELKAHFQDNTYYPANVGWRGVRAESVAIRSRGRGSRSPIKPNLRVDINRFDNTQRFLGLKAFHLKANNEDPSFIKERITMSLFRRIGIPASREASTRVYVNGDYIGLYLIVEEVKEDFLQFNLNESDGYLFEWKPMDEPYHFEYLGSDLTRYVPLPFDPKTHETDPDGRPIEALIRTANEASNTDFPSAIANYIDLKRFATHVGLENYLSDIDGILGDLVGMNNFMIYIPKGKTLSVLFPWDKDMTFMFTDRGIFQSGGSNVLMRRALAIPEIRTAYLEAIAKSAVLSGGADGWLEQELTRAYNQVSQAAHDDTFKQYMANGFLQSSSDEIFDNEATRISTFPRDRTESVLRQLTAAGFRPSQDGPSLNPDTGIVDTSSGAAGTLTPGAVVSLSGDRLSSTTAAADPDTSPTTLGGVSVFINGFAATLLSVSPTQIQIRVPLQLKPGTVPVTVIANGVLGNTITANAVAPGGAPI